MTVLHPESLTGSAEEVLLLILLKLFKQQPGRNEERTERKVFRKRRFKGFAVLSHSTLTSRMIDLGACYFRE